MPCSTTTPVSRSHGTRVCQTGRLTAAGVALAALLTMPIASLVSAESPADDLKVYPEFSVIPRQGELVFYPCADCHEFLDPNLEIRELDPDPGHPAALEHGEGEVWCTSCHIQSPYDSLHTLLGEPVGFNESYRVSGGCHSHKLKDWTYGAHGKRVDNWRGERLLNGCPECHNPHSPAIKPRAPQPPPPVRAGLERVDGHEVKEPPIWEELREESSHE